MEANDFFQAPRLRSHLLQVEHFVDVFWGKICVFFVCLCFIVFVFAFRFLLLVKKKNKQNKSILFSW